MSIELERKFLINDERFNYLRFKNKKISIKLQKDITQKYLYKNGGMVFRILHDSLNNDYCLQAKLKREDLTHEADFEINMDDKSHAEIAKVLLEENSDAVIKKMRFLVHDDRVNDDIWNECTIDIFISTSLNLIEVEFKSREQMERFEPLDWFGKEVTDDSDYRNENIATRDWDYFVKRK